MIAHLTWDTFLYLGILVIQNAFSTLRVMNSNLLNVFPLTEFEKKISFLDTRSNSKIIFIKTNCAVIYCGNDNGSHMYCGKRKPLYIGFLSWTFAIYRIAGEGGGYFFNSSLTLPPTSQLKLDISLTITTDSSPLHIAISCTQTRNLWFLSGSC